MKIYKSKLYKKLFYNRFGSQSILWHLLNLIRKVVAYFNADYIIVKHPNKFVQHKGAVGPVSPKKWKHADISRWSLPVLALALGGMLWVANETLNFTEYTDVNGGGSSNISQTAQGATSNNSEEDDETINILSLELEQIENLANTIAGRNAIWPKYKGDETDHKAVQSHFSQNFAKFINSGIIQVEPSWNGRSIAFAYAVTAEGVVAFVGAIPGGTIIAADNPEIYATVSKGISGKIIVTPAQDEAGENIIMLYYIKVKFTIQ